MFAIEGNKKGSTQQTLPALLGLTRKYPVKKVNLVKVIEAVNPTQRRVTRPGHPYMKETVAPRKVVVSTIPMEGMSGTRTNLTATRGATGVRRALTRETQMWADPASCGGDYRGLWTLRLKALENHWDAWIAYGERQKVKTIAEGWQIAERERGQYPQHFRDVNDPEFVGCGPSAHFEASSHLGASTVRQSETATSPMKMVESDASAEVSQAADGGDIGVGDISDGVMDFGTMTGAVPSSSMASSGAVASSSMVSSGAVASSAMASSGAADDIMTFPEVSGAVTGADELPYMSIEDVIALYDMPIFSS